MEMHARSYMEVQKNTACTCENLTNNPHKNRS